MPATPVLSVVVIAHQSPHLIAPVVAAFAGGDAWGCECILIDDGADPEIAKQCREASRGSVHIRLLRHKVREGVATCRNSALRMARGDYVLMADTLAVFDLPALRARALAAPAKGEVAAQSVPDVVFPADLLRQAGGWDETLGDAADTDLLARLHGAGGVTPRPVDILFIPHKDYHVWTISLLRAEMEKQGLTFDIMDITAQWRDDGVRAMAGAHDLPLVKLSPWVLGHIAPRLVVVFNDWDPITRPLVLAAQAAGMATAGIVEGIQDYADADVPWSRQAYQAVDTVLLPGDFDKAYFQQRRAGQGTAVVGVARIEALRAQPIDPNRRPAGAGRVLINSNFAYDVLVDERDAWLTQAVDAVLAAGMEPVVSRHPADKGTLFPQYATEMDFYSCLETCQATIQRFASGVLESLARDVPVLYFKPRHEKVEKFTADPMGVYPVCETAADLDAALANLPAWQEAVDQKAGAFLDHHAGHKGGNVTVSTVTALRAALGSVPEAQVLTAFQNLMLGVDRITHAFTKPGGREKALFGTLEQTETVLAKCRKVANLAPAPRRPPALQKPKIKPPRKRGLARIIAGLRRRLLGR